MSLEQFEVMHEPENDEYTVVRAEDGGQIVLFFVERIALESIFGWSGSLPGERPTPKDCSATVDQNIGVLVKVFKEKYGRNEYQLKSWNGSSLKTVTIAYADIVKIKIALRDTVRELHEKFWSANVG